MISTVCSEIYHNFGLNTARIVQSFLLSLDKQVGSTGNSKFKVENSFREPQLATRSPQEEEGLVLAHQRHVMLKKEWATFSPEFTKLAIGSQMRPNTPSLDVIWQKYESIYSVFLKAAKIPGMSHE